MSSWKRGEYDIETVEGLQTVKGAVLDGVLGVHRAGKRKAFYAVTHLPTGSAVSPYGGFARHMTAKAYAERILPLADWQAVTKQNAAQRIDGWLLVDIAHALWTEEAA